jgi:tRNA A-37 threonylcarbamoyl transferase component Bud32
LTSSPRPAAPDPAFAKVWETIASDETVRLPALSTRVPKGLPASAPEWNALKTLPIIAVGSSSAHTELELGEVIGRGGMGVVRAATQVALARPVAVKTVRADQLSLETQRELLREARLTGVLQHPNIVPVYDLGVDCDGSPVLVMKRIEGTVWSEQLYGHRTPGATCLDGDELERQLDVLMQVCNAMSFAHSQGVVHRDLKPDNVMVGHFGEVYVVDWGVALHLNEAQRLAGGEFRGVAGTPAYMAPEMISGTLDGLDERTDVYLLGGLLHTILTGLARHRGEDVFAVMYLAFQSQPATYDASVPTELAELCNRTCHRDPRQRPQTARAFREALADFLRHRSSIQLAHEAASREETLAQVIDGLGPMGDPLLDEKTNVSLAAEVAGLVYNLFGECRFGYQQALRTWPQNGLAEAGLESVLGRMARYEIHHGELRAASLLVGDMRHPPADLLRELENLAQRLKQHEAQFVQLKKLQHEMDFKVGGKLRSEFVVAIGVVWALLPAGFGVLDLMGLYQPNYTGYLLSIVFLAAFVGAGVWIGRRVLLQNRANRSFVQLLATGVFVLAAHRSMAWWQQVPLPQALADDLLILFLILAALAATINARMLWGALIYFTAAMLAVQFPSWAYILMGAANFLALAQVASVWRPSTQEEAKAQADAQAQVAQKRALIEAAGAATRHRPRPPTPRT